MGVVPATGRAKSGVISLTRAMAADYFQDHIRVSCVCRSAIQTAMYTDLIATRLGTCPALDQAIEQARQGDQGLTLPEEIAPVFMFLASDQLSRKVTGHILLAENGYSILRL